MNKNLIIGLLIVLGISALVILKAKIQSTVVIQESRAVISPRVILAPSTNNESPRGEKMRIKIPVIYLDSNGGVGCGDSIEFVNRDVPHTMEVLKTAYTELFSLHDQYYGESGFYNALYQSNLKFEKANIKDSKAEIYLSGTHVLGGTCDTPRFIAQLEQIALQFPSINEVVIYINSTEIHELLSEK